GDGGPVRVLLDALAELAVGEHVDRLVLTHELIEDARNRRREAAAWCLRSPFHEQHDVVALDVFLDFLAGGFVHTGLTHAATLWPCQRGPVNAAPMNAPCLAMGHLRAAPAP